MKIKNTKTSLDVWCGQSIDSGSYYTIQQNELVRFQSDSKTITDISSGDLLVNDGTSNISDISNAVNLFLGTGIKSVNIYYDPPFASKTVGTFKLYTRTNGKKFELEAGANNCDFTIPYDVCKFNGLELIGAEVGDTATLKVLDTATGTITGVANYVLNTFGVDVNVPKDFYSRESKYDADMIKNLQVRVVYTSISAKTIGINYMLHELKT